jgi:hypothetical protein
MEDLPMIDTIPDAARRSSAPAADDVTEPPVLRPEARATRADRSLAAMVFIICTLGGMGVGFGFAMYLMRAQLAYAPLCSGGANIDLVPGQTWLGVSYNPSKRFPPVVKNVFAHTAADQAGLRSGDILMKLDGRDLRGVDLQDAVVEHSPGEIVPIVVMRGGQRLLLYARLGLL